QDQAEAAVAVAAARHSLHLDLPLRRRQPTHRHPMPEGLLMRELITLPQATLLLANTLSCRASAAEQHLASSGIRTYRAGRRTVIDRAAVLALADRITKGGDR